MYLLLFVLRQADPQRFLSARQPFLCQTQFLRHRGNPLTHARDRPLMLLAAPFLSFSANSVQLTLASTHDPAL